MTLSNAPDKPFDVIVPTTDGGVKKLPPKFSLPFDTEWRSSTIPNIDSMAKDAYLCIGVEVYNAGTKYVPDYHIIGTMNARLATTKSAVDAWTKATLQENILITDRRTGTMVALHASFSILLAAMSWFAREPGHESSVLCWDRTDGHQGFYIEPMRTDCVLALASDGTEVPIDEPHERVQYRTDMHPNAIMAFGE